MVVDLANEACLQGHEVTVVAAVPADPLLLQNDLLEQVAVRFICPTTQSRMDRYRHMILWLYSHWSWLRTQDVVHRHLTLSSFLGTAIQ